MKCNRKHATLYCWGQETENGEWVLFVPYVGGRELLTIAPLPKLSANNEPLFLLAPPIACTYVMAVSGPLIVLSCTIPWKCLI